MPTDVYEDAGGSWRWRLTAANGEVVASGESHRDRSDAERALDAALKLAGHEHVLRTTTPEPEGVE